MSAITFDPIDLRERGITVANMGMEVSNDGVTWALAKAGTDLTSYRWMRTPALPEPTIEQRRAGLKVGDVIRDPALLCEGMIVGAATCPGSTRPTTGLVIRERCWNREWSTGEWLVTDDEFPQGKVTFLGYTDKPAPEVKGRDDYGDHLEAVKQRASETMKPGAIMELKVSAQSIADELIKLADQQRAAAYAQAGIPNTPGVLDSFYSQNAAAYNQPGQWASYAWNSAGEGQIYAGYQRAAVGSDCARAIHKHRNGVTELCGPECEYRVATPPAKPLPFRRHEMCDAVHAETLCMNCERLIAESARMREDFTPAAKPTTRTPYEPQCGAFVGRVMTPVVRR